MIPSDHHKRPCDFHTIVACRPVIFIPLLMPPLFLWYCHRGLPFTWSLHVSHVIFTSFAMPSCYFQVIVMCQTHYFPVIVPCQTSDPHMVITYQPCDFQVIVPCWTRDFHMIIMFQLYNCHMIVKCRVSDFNMIVMCKPCDFYTFVNANMTLMQ